MKKKLIVIIIFIWTICYGFSEIPVQQITQILKDEQWGIWYYLDVLRSGKRETIYNYIQEFKENPRNWAPEYDGWVYWYEQSQWTKSCIAILSSRQAHRVDISPLHYYEIINITNNSASTLFKISVFVSKNKMEDNRSFDKYIGVNWDLINTKSELTFLFLFDGDYLDIFIDDFNTYFTTFCHFSNSAWEQLENLIYTNTCDLSNITWPRRADKIHTVGATCIVAESLRLRKEENTTSATLQTMQPGTPVQIQQLGKKQTIDGITANWVQVELADGTTGWCFGGWLVEK